MKHQEIKQLLPEVFQRADHAGSPLHSILDVMQTLTEPAEDILQQVPVFFNPYTTPEKFLPFLASWVDLDRFFPALQKQAATNTYTLQIIDAGRLRELIIAAPQLSKSRGTAEGMILFLETATGFQGFEINENISDKSSEVLPFYIKVTAPENSQKHRTLIERIIEQEKPAYVTYDLIFRPEKTEKNHG